DGGLLDELEREPAADAENGALEWEQAFEDRPADDLVHRVVAADVLAHAEQPAGRVEEAGRVEAARGGEGRLRLAQPLGQGGDDADRHAERALDPRGLDGDGLE